MPYDDAIKKGYRGAFKERYPGAVTCYNIGGYSREICRGPHVKNTKELGKFRIVKEESSSAGVRRIKAILEK
jgi:alanyl-tRNA synthetase